ncbi:hypothetical protein Tco_1007936 [Tanacetum coccineum]
MPYPRFTKIIINHFLKQHKSLTNLNHKHYHTIKDDGIVRRLKFVRISKDYQEYRHPIPDVMLTDAIKRSESYQMFIKYSTNQIPPKKSRGKGSKGKKTAEESQETVDVSKESKPKPEPELAKKNTSGKRIVKKKVTLFTDDNIISDDPNAALELAKFINQTEAEEAEAARKVYATHARIMTETVPESTKKKSSGRSSKSVNKKLQTLCKLSRKVKKTSKTQLGTGGSNEGTSSKPGDKDITKEKVILEWGNKQDSEFFDDDNDNVEKDDKDGNVDDEGDDHASDTQDVDDEDVKTEYDEDDIYKHKIREEKFTDVAKEEAEKTSEAKDDAKKTKLPPLSSSLSVSLGFGDQFLKLSSDPSLVSTVKDFADADVMIPKTTNLPPIPEIVTETLVLTNVPSPQVTPIFSYVQQTPTPPITTDALTVTTIVPESNALSAVELRVAKLEKDVPELKTVDHSSEALVVL